LQTRAEKTIMILYFKFIIEQLYLIASSKNEYCTGSEYAYCTGSEHAYCPGFEDAFCTCCKDECCSGRAVVI